MSVPTKLLPYQICRLPTTQLVFVRHGETDWNKRGLMQGRTDIALNDTGFHQAHRQGLVLKENLDGDSTRTIFVSPLERARQTAEVICKYLDYSIEQIVVDSRLQELGLGEWEGLSLEQVLGNYRDSYERRLNDLFYTSPPGGESYAQLWQRLASFIDTIQNPSVLVTHTGIIRLAVACIANQSPSLLETHEISQSCPVIWDGNSISFGFPLPSRN